jgi:MFS family permease
MILILHYIAKTIGSLIVTEYTYQYFSTQTDGKTNQLKISHASSNENCTTHKNDAQKKAAHWNSYYEYAEYGPGLFMVVFSGVMSDYYGRKFFIVLPLLGTFIRYFATLVVLQYNLDIMYLLGGCLLEGFSGTHYTMNIAIAGVIADISKYDKSRTFNFALLHLYSGIGTTAAQASTGYMIKNFGFLIPCLVSVAMCFLDVLVGLYVPETLPKFKRKTSSDTVCQKSIRFFAFYTSSSNLRDGKVWQFVLCLLSLGFCLSPYTTRGSIDIIYFLGQPFCFSSEKIGWYNSANSFLCLCISVFVLKLFHLCLNDEFITILSCISGIMCFTVEGFASVWWMLYIGKLSCYHDQQNVFNQKCQRVPFSRQPKGYMKDIMYKTPKQLKL